MFALKVVFGSIIAFVMFKIVIPAMVILLAIAMFG
jgi:hypothetical protein